MYSPEISYERSRYSQYTSVPGNVSDRLRKRSPSTDRAVPVQKLSKRRNCVDPFGRDKRRKVRRTSLENTVKELQAQVAELRDHQGRTESGSTDEGGKPSVESTIMVEKPNVRWSDVAGLETAKQALKEAAVIPLQRPDLFDSKCCPWKGILLFGPPGTGKSQLAKAVANEAGGCTFFSVSASDITSMWMGQSEGRVRELFNSARQHKPSVIFIDEVDALCMSRKSESSCMRGILTELLVQMDGVGKSMDGIVVIGATNTPWALDDAIRRRFEKRIYIPLPTQEGRDNIFRMQFRGMPSKLTDADYESFARRTTDYSGHDIAIVCKEAMMARVRSLYNATHFRLINVPAMGGHVRPLYEVCYRGESGAIRMSFMDIPIGGYIKPPVTRYHVEKALDSCKATLNTESAQQLEDYLEKYGQHGSR